MTGSDARRAAAVLAEGALRQVFEPGIVDGLREDSPLSALGYVPSDAVCIVDAVASLSGGESDRVVLTDADLGEMTRVSDLVDAILEVRERAVPGTEDA